MLKQGHETLVKLLLSSLNGVSRCHYQQSCSGEGGICNYNLITSMHKWWEHVSTGKERLHDIPSIVR
jgi:hypothetical protein